MQDEFFISYSHQDKKWLDKLQVMLKPLLRSDKIRVWDDTKIAAGSEWRNEIANALDSAGVAVLLVTPDFLASDFIANHELPKLLGAAEQKGLKILWLPIRASLFGETEIAKYQALIDPQKPLSSLRKADQDKELVRVCQIIKRTALGYNASTSRSASDEKAVPVRSEASILDRVPDGTTIGNSQPVLVFVYDNQKGWLIRNVGTLPVLSAVVAERRAIGEWESPVIIPPVGASETLHLSWIGHRNIDVVGAEYKGSGEQVFATVCMHDNNTIQEGRIFPDWPPSSTPRFWNVGMEKTSPRR